MHRGYVKNWRKIEDSPWYKKPKISHLAQHLIRNANYADKKTIFNNKPLVIKKGQLLTGLFALSKETGLSIQNIRTALKVLINCGFLTSKVTNKFTILTISNYDIYQSDENETNKQTNKQITNKQQTNNKQITTSKELKELKNLKKEKEKIYKKEKVSYFSKKEVVDISEYWLTKKIHQHRKITDNLKESIHALLREYTISEIKQGIDNYRQTLDHPDCPTYIKKITLTEFCERHKGLCFRKYFTPDNFNINELCKPPMYGKQQRTKIKSNIDWNKIKKNIEVVEL